MNIEAKKSIIFSSLFIIMVTAALSVFASIPYIFTVCGLSVLATIGHLVTLDDDMPGEWSNMERSKDIWRNSRIQLGIKFLIMVALIVVTITIPELRNYGS